MVLEGSGPMADMIAHVMGKSEVTQADIQRHIKFSGQEEYNSSEIKEWAEKVLQMNMSLDT